MTYIHAIETLIAGRTYAQDHAGAKMIEWLSDETDRRLVRALYGRSGIEQRHTVIESFDEGRPDDFFLRDTSGRLIERGTAYRNDLYAQASRPLAVTLTRNLLNQSHGLDLSSVSHVITASCTGFYSPGMDYHIIRELGLSQHTQRYHLGFMGCYAALPALRMAHQFCQADPKAVVLVLCLELCSLHLRLAGGADTILANSLFSDGAAAVLVSARPPQGPAYHLKTFASTLVPEGEQDMSWTVGDHGFDIGLSSYVARILGGSIRQAIEPALRSGGLELEDIHTWAVHPGGKSIVDKVQQGLGLRPEQVAASREILRAHGNMSSATVLFVLDAIRRSPGAAPGEHVCAMAFGPGLTVEMVVLECAGC